MRHRWEDVQQGPEGIGNHGKRRCAHCGAVQVKEAQQNWGRVVGYRWEPLVGRCPGPPHGSLTNNQFTEE